MSLNGASYGAYRGFVAHAKEHGLPDVALAQLTQQVAHRGAADDAAERVERSSGSAAAPLGALAGQPAPAYGFAGACSAVPLLSGVHGAAKRLRNGRMRPVSCCLLHIGRRTPADAGAWHILTSGAQRYLARRRRRSHRCADGAASSHFLARRNMRTWPGRPAGMRHIFDEGSARATVLRFGRLSSELLAWGAADGTVRVATLADPPRVLHARPTWPLPDCFAACTGTFWGAPLHAGTACGARIAVTTWPLAIPLCPLHVCLITALCSAGLG